MKKVRAPKGFYFTIRKYPTDLNGEEISIELRNSNNTLRIGSICLKRHNKKSFETHSYLEEEYHGRGLGTLLYAKAIQWGIDNGYVIRSSDTTSFEAQRVWRSVGLREYFTVVARKDPDMKHNRNFDMFFAYPQRSK